MTDQRITDPADLQAGDVVTVQDTQTGTIVTGDIHPFGLPRDGWQVWGISFSSAVPGAEPRSVLFTFDPAHARFTLCAATRVQEGGVTMHRPDPEDTDEPEGQADRTVYDVDDW